METIIDVQNITFEYENDDQSVGVLKDFSVEFKKGQFTAVLGHNGSGKSTLAKLLNGLLLPQSGKVLVNGIDTADEEKSIEVKRTVGMVFQNPDNQLVATVVDEDVAFGLENGRVTATETIDALFHIPNHKQVVAVGYIFKNFVLQKTCVLILVHQNFIVSVSHFLCNVRIF